MQHVPANFSPDHVIATAKLTLREARKEATNAILTMTTKVPPSLYYNLDSATKWMLQDCLEAAVLITCEFKDVLAGQSRVNKYRNSK